MKTVSHREMRNNSGEILRLVAAGETVEVTNNGQVAAVITSPGSDALTRLAELGQTRAARRPVADLATIRRRPAKLTSAEIVDDIRGQW